MREIILHSKQSKTIPFFEVHEQKPIFAKQNEQLVGMAVHEEQGWILRIGGTLGATGHHETLEKCLKSCIEYGYTFFQE